MRLLESPKSTHDVRKEHVVLNVSNIQIQDEVFVERYL